MRSEYNAWEPAPPPAAPRRSNRNRIFLLLGGGCALLLLCAVCLFAVVAMGGLAALGIGTTFAPIDAVANSFMTGLRDGDWQQAYSQLAPELHREVGNVNQFQQLITRGQAVPASWNWTSRNVNNDVATWTGTAQFKSGRSGTAELELLRRGNDWRIVSFDLQPE